MCLSNDAVSNSTGWASKSASLHWPRVGALVALSRLVLGAHWPTDVLAAAVLGVSIPLAISTLLDRHPQRWLSPI